MRLDPRTGNVTPLLRGIRAGVMELDPSGAPPVHRDASQREILVMEP